MSISKLFIGGIISLFLGCVYVTSASQIAQAPTTIISVPITPAPIAGKLTVLKVVDGDTIDVAGSNPVRQRAIGINTPEVYGGKECFGPEASAKMKELLPVGTEIRLVEDTGKPDRYGRRLTYIYRASDNLFVNAEMVKTGYAKAYPYGKDLAHKDEFARLESEAKAERRGLWGAC